MSNFSVCFVIYEYYYQGIPTTNNNDTGIVILA